MLWDLKALLPSILTSSRSFADFPSKIPWEAKDKGCKQANQEEPKFVADSPQEGLARQLRMCGFDTKSYLDIEAKASRLKAYRLSRCTILNSCLQVINETDGQPSEANKHEAEGLGWQLLP